MAISPTYSNVFRRTLDRVWAAVEDHKDSLEAAANFEKNPLKNGLNEAWTHFGFTDLYDDQKKEKIRFACAVLMAADAFTDDSSSLAAETLKVNDTQGIERECRLKKAEDQAELVEVIKPFLYYEGCERVIYIYSSAEVAEMQRTVQEAAEQVKNQFSSVLTHQEDTDPSDLVKLLTNDKQFRLHVMGKTLKNAATEDSNTVTGAAILILDNAKACKEEDITRAAAVVSDIVEKAPQFPVQHVRDCVLRAVKHASLFVPEVYQWAAEYFFRHAAQYQKEEVLACAEYVVKNDEFFSREVVRVAIDKLCADEVYRHEMAKEIAWAIVNLSRSFFETSILEQAEFASFEFASFYITRDATDVIQSFSTRFMEALHLDQRDITVESRGNINVFGRSINVVNKVTKKVEKSFVGFFKEPRNDQNIKTAYIRGKRIVSVASLWKEGSFEAAIRGSKNVTEFLIESRGDKAITLWYSESEAMKSTHATRLALEEIG